MATEISDCLNVANPISEFYMPAPYAARSFQIGIQFKCYMMCDAA